MGSFDNRAVKQEADAILHEASETSDISRDSQPSSTWNCAKAATILTTTDDFLWKTFSHGNCYLIYHDSGATLNHTRSQIDLDKLQLFVFQARDEHTKVRQTNLRLHPMLSL